MPGPQMLAGVVPRPMAMAATANLGLPAGSLPSGTGDPAAYYQQLHQQAAAPGALLPTGMPSMSCQQACGSDRYAVPVL